MNELWIAREILSKEGKPGKDAQLPTWKGYLEEVGLAKRTARLGELLSNQVPLREPGGTFGNTLPFSVNKKQSHYAQEINREGFF